MKDDDDDEAKIAEELSKDQEEFDETEKAQKVKLAKDEEDSINARTEDEIGEPREETRYHIVNADAKPDNNCPAWCQMPEKVIQPLEQMQCLGYDPIGKFAQIFDILVANILRRAYGAVWKTYGDGDADKFYQAQKDKIHGTMVGIPFPVPFTAEDLDKDERRFPSKGALRKYWEESDGGKRRDWGGYLSGYSILPLFAQIMMYLVRINVSFEVLRELLDLDTAYKTKDDIVFDERKRQVSIIIKRIIRGATGYEHYAYFSMAEGGHILKIDPVAVMNFSEVGKKGALRQWQSVCRAMHVTMTPKFERDFDESKEKDLAGHMGRSRLLDTGGEGTETAMLRDMQAPRSTATTGTAAASNLVGARPKPKARPHEGTSTEMDTSEGHRGDATPGTGSAPSTLIPSKAMPTSPPPKARPPTVTRRREEQEFQHRFDRQNRQYLREITFHHVVNPHPVARQVHPHRAMQRHLPRLPILRNLLRRPNCRQKGKDRKDRKARAMASMKMCQKGETRERQNGFLEERVQVMPHQLIWKLSQIVCADRRITKMNTTDVDVVDVNESALHDLVRRLSVGHKPSLDVVLLTSIDTNSFN